ncbi:trafficking PGA2 [Zalerion maritima]|uniref:Trafficking PGA2 n=1 Tax=Zalerion maritima TaxID=339359 RepID=A0AAD5WS78_9PEZI|nr:trafficking PGA2 [Zalerion maritima]
MDVIQNLLSTGRERLSRNLVEPLKEIDTTSWIRLVIIVCGYLLLRPYLVKFGEKQAMKGYEEASADGSELSGKKKTKGKVDPNDLRNLVDIPDNTDSEGDDEGEGETTAANVKASEWGTKARRRQRRVVKQILEQEEKRIQEALGDDEDKDIEEFLEN